MFLIEDYIFLDKRERQNHLDLSEPCIERGGHKTLLSTQCKALLAHILDTTIPSGSKIHCCHACNNDRCCNPKHLYWGTARENVDDGIQNGTIKSIYENTKNKYGEKRYKEMLSKNGKKFGYLGGLKSKGKPKSEEHKEKLRQANLGKKHIRNAGVM